MDDPLTDPRATDLMSAQPGDVDLLVCDYDDACRRAHFTARGLRAASQDTRWSGAAADRFRSSTGELPRQLDAVCNGYYEVMVALRHYAHAVAELQAQWSRVAGELSGARARLAAARTTEREDAATLRSLLRPGSGATAKERWRAQCAVWSDQATVTELEGSVGGSARRAQSILDGFEALRTTVAGRVDAAATHAIGAASFVGAPRVGDPSGSAPAPVRGPTAGARRSGGRVRRPTDAIAGERLARMDAYIRSVMGTRYVYGGGHASFSPNGGLDCSGFVSGVLHSAGYLSAPQTTQTLAAQAGVDAGPGRYVTIYDRTNVPTDDQHVIIDVNGQFYEEGGISSGGAPDVHRFTPSAEYLASFNQVLHPAGM